MIRRSLFWGLTLVLIVALTFLINRSCRLEKEQAQQLVETIEQAKPSSTRALEPRDLKIVQSKMELESADSGDKTSSTARQEIEIYNGGNAPYREIQLRFAYRDRSGKVIASKTYSVTQTIRPGGALKLDNIKIADIPSSAATLQATIVYADIGLSSSSKQ